MDVLYIEQLLYNWRCLFSGLELDVRCSTIGKLWLQTRITVFFLISHLCVHPQIDWKLQIVYGSSAYWTTALLVGIFLWFRVCWVIWLENYVPRHTSVILWHNIVCVYCKPIHALLFSAQPCMTKNSCTLRLHTTHSVMALLPKMHHFIRTKLASYMCTTCWSVFPINRAC